jgi:virginiamycin B lyase
MKHIWICLLACSLSLPSLVASGILWIAETGPYPNRLIGFDTGRQLFVSASEVPSGGAIRHMYYDGDADDFWFGVDSGYIARGRHR